jgi:hypothetical protein
MNLRLPIFAAACLQAFLIKLSAADYYVAKDGSDANEGSLSAPFTTISKAVQQLDPGDNLFIREGVYRESVVLNRSGTAEKPITIQAYGLDAVEISGVDEVKASWKLHDAAKGIYSIRMDPEILQEAIVGDSFQVFVDKHSLLPARWPNTSYDEILTRKGWQAGGKGARFGHFEVPELIDSDLDLEGVDIYLNIIHQFFTWKREVTAFDPKTGRLEYPQDIVVGPHFFKEGTYWDRQGWSDDYFYLQGSYELLDYPGEFHYDAEAGVLYMIPPNGEDPNTARVEIKTRLYGLKGNNLAHVKIEGIDLFGCAFRFERCNRMKLSGMTVLYPIAQQEVAEVRGKSEWERVRTSISGSHNVLEDLYIAHSKTSGLNMGGNNNLLDNSIIHNACYSGSLVDKCVGAHGDSVVRRSTIFNSGNVGVHFSGESFLLELNHVYNNGLLSHDVSSIYTAGAKAMKSRVSHNWVHDNPSPTGSIGIRGDDLTRGLTVDHNVVWNTTVGITVKGDYNSVFNNTVFNARRFDILLEDEPEPRKEFQVEAGKEFLDAQNQNTFYYNNLVNDETSAKHGLKGESIPIERKGSGFIYEGEPPLVDVDALNFRPLEAFRDELIGKPLPADTVIPVELDVSGQPYIGAYSFDGPYWKPGAIHGMRYQLVESEGEQMLRFKYSLPLLADDTLTVTVNGQQLGAETVSKERSMQPFEVPLTLRSGEHSLVFSSELHGELSVTVSEDTQHAVFMERFPEPSYVR